MILSANPQSIELQAKLFRGFGDPSRLGILQALRSAPLTVSEITRQTGLSQPNVSNHLACLRDCGLVSSDQRGRTVDLPTERRACCATVIAGRSAAGRSGARCV